MPLHWPTAKQHAARPRPLTRRRASKVAKNSTGAVGQHPPVGDATAEVALWQFDPVDPEANLSLAGFVAQSDWFVDEIVGAAFSRFCRYSAGRFVNYQSAVDSDDPAVLRLILASLYNQARVECARRSIRYEFERSFDPRSGRQRVLRPAEIVHGRNGTCLDWTLLGASIAAQVKLLPIAAVLMLPQGLHAVMAVHLTRPRGDRPAALPLTALVREIELGGAVALDCTGLAVTTSDRLGQRTFRAACRDAFFCAQAAARHDESNDTGARSALVDVWRAWELGHHPFSQRDVESLRRALSPPDQSRLVARLTTDFVGREAIFSEVAGWLDRSDDDDQVYWICGDPGVGKSAIAAQASLRFEPHLAARHFCAYDDVALSSARGLACSLAFQLSERLPGYHAWLSRQDLARLLSQEAGKLFHDILCVGVQASSPAADWSWLVVVDALDEATLDRENALATFIGRAISYQQLPRGLKLLVTSRPTPIVTRALAGVRPRPLAAAEPANIEDIRTYLAHKLAGRVAGQDLAAIAGRSNGVFLYAKAVAESFLRDPTLAPTLDGLFAWQRSCLTRGFDGVHWLYEGCARPLLEVVCAAPAPLPRAFLQDSLRLDVATLQSMFERLADVVEIHGGTVRFRHLSFKDWLTDGERAGSFVLDERQGRAYLADACWAAAEGQWADPSGYALKHLASVLLAAGDIQRLARALLRPELALFDRWIDAGESAVGVATLTTVVRHLEVNVENRLLVAGFATQIARMCQIGRDSAKARDWLALTLRSTSWFSGRRLRSIALHELGSLALSEGRHGEARAFYRRALRLAIYGSPSYLDEAAGNLLGLATLSVGKQAIRYGLRALDFARRANDTRHLVSGGRIVAAAYKRAGQFERAFELLELALRTATAHGIHLERSRALAELASVQYWSECLEGHPSNAEQAYREALNSAETIDDSYGVLRARLGLGFCALQRWSTEDAEASFGKLRIKLDRGVHPEMHAFVAHGRACVCHQRGELRLAAKNYQDVIEQCARFPEWLYSLHAAAAVGLGATLWHEDQDADAAERMWSLAVRLSAREAGIARMTVHNIARCKRDRLAHPL